jgi:hypothetical protein
MKFSKIALAAVVTLAAAQAQAATVYLAGASATQANQIAGLVTLCPGTATTITSTADANKKAVKCSVDFTGLTGINAVSISVSGGSFSAVTTSVGSVTEAFVDVSDNSGNTLTAPRQSEGGFLDIDGAAWSPTVLAANGVSGSPATTPAKYAQVFGVAVSPDLYTALQAAQGLTGCGIDSVAPACQPTISKAQYVSIANETFNTAKQNINAILGVGAEGDKLTLCRRVATSGTQASSDQYFLNSFVGGDGAAGGALVPADEATYGAASGLPSYEVKEGSGTSNVRTCLSAPGYALGVTSLENVPDLTTRSGGQRADRKYRYVKINGVHAYDTANNSTATAKSGAYDFWFQSHKFAITDNGAAVLNALDDLLGTINLQGLYGTELSDVKAKRVSNTSPIFFN